MLDPRVELLSEDDIDELAQKARRKAELDGDEWWSEFYDYGPHHPPLVR